MLILPTIHPLTSQGNKESWFCAPWGQNTLNRVPTAVCGGRAREASLGNGALRGSGRGLVAQLESAKLVLPVAGRETRRHRSPRRSCPASATAAAPQESLCFLARAGNSTPMQAVYLQSSAPASPPREGPSFPVCKQGTPGFPHPRHQLRIPPSEQTPPATGKCCRMDKNTFVPVLLGNWGSGPPARTPWPRMLDGSRNVKDTAQVKSTSFAL